MFIALSTGLMIMRQLAEDFEKQCFKLKIMMNLTHVIHGLWFFFHFDDTTIHLF